jgi:hypothetical protein
MSDGNVNFTPPASPTPTHTVVIFYKKNVTMFYHPLWCQWYAFYTLTNPYFVINPANVMIVDQDADAAFMVGAFPRLPGMERKDLLTKNIDIFRVIDH